MDWRQYTTILGKLVYGEDGDIPAEALQDEFLRQAKADGLGAFCHCCLHGRLEGKNGDKLRKLWQKQSVLNLEYEVALKSLSKILTEATVRFLFIKGGDLAFRVYPYASMRSFGDLDVLLHPDDCQRGLACLEQHGWQSLYKYPQWWWHHFSPYTKGNCVLEPHWTLPGFDGIKPEQIWKYAVPTGEGTSHVLSPEMNLLMLSRHLSEDSYRVFSLGKFLLDVAFLLKYENVDWGKLQNICAELALPYPGDILAVFDTFFPPEMLASWPSDSPSSQAFREILETRGAMRQISRHEMIMSEKGAFSFSWLRSRLAFFHPHNVRKKYDLPARGALGRLLAAYIRDVVAKIYDLRLLIFRKSGLSQYQRLVSKVEKTAKLR